jgi:hypothetical protein
VLCFACIQHFVVRRFGPSKRLKAMRAGVGANAALARRPKAPGAPERMSTMDSPNPAKKIAAPLIAILLLCLLAACGPVLSIHPLYTDKDVVFDPGLVGTWIDPTDKDEPISFERGPGDSYKAITRLVNDVNVEQIFEARLVKLNGRLFLDAVQTKNRISGKEEDMGIAIPGHLFARVSIQGDTLGLDLLDEDWIKDQLEAGKISIAHEDEGDNVVLTASTADLQKFVVAHADDEKAFPKSGPLQRKK